MPKINFFIHFFLEILHSKEPCSLIGQQHFSPLPENLTFARYEIGEEVLITILFFISEYYFQKKRMAKFLKKSKKALLWGHFKSFLPKLGQT